MSIVSSTYTEGPKQVDSRRYVKEKHTDSSGNIYEYEWLGNQDANLVLNARVDILNTQLVAKSAAEALVLGTLLPITKLEFRELFTPSEQYLLDAFEYSFESNPNFSEEVKAVVRTGYKNFDNAFDIAKPFDARVISMLDLFVSLGLLTLERHTEIVEAGNG